MVLGTIVAPVLSYGLRSCFLSYFSMVSTIWATIMATEKGGGLVWCTVLCGS